MGLKIAKNSCASLRDLPISAFRFKSDWEVYALYGLSEEEIKRVRRKNRLLILIVYN